MEPFQNNLYGLHEKQHRGRLLHGVNSYKLSGNRCYFSKEKKRLIHVSIPCNASTLSLQTLKALQVNEIFGNTLYLTRIHWSPNHAIFGGKKGQCLLNPKNIYLFIVEVT